MRKTLVVATVLLTGMVYAQQEVSVSGRLRGYDGKPMAHSHVHLLTAGSSQPVASAQVGKDGTFQLNGSAGAMAYIEFTGVGHASRKYFVLADRPIKLQLEVRLTTYPYLEELKEVKIIGDFNNFNFTTAQLMKKEADGTYSAEFESGVKKFKYQLVGLTPTSRSVNGTQSEDFEYDGGGDYRSIVTPVNGKVRVIFDPKRLVRSNAEPSVKVPDNLLMENFFSLQTDMQKREAAFQAAIGAHQRAGKDMKEFSYNWSNDVAYLSSEVKGEKEPLLRKMLLMNYLQLAQFGARLTDQDAAKLALDEIELSSPLWSLSPMMLRIAVSTAGLYDNYDDYLARFLKENPDKNAKANLVFNEAMNAKFRNDGDKLKKYYDVLMKEYGDSPLAQMARSRLSPDAKITVGKTVPSFSFASMEDPNQNYSKESMKGRYYLIDFWAVWCGPCIGEMENLHKAYEKFKKKNFEILSLSFDQAAADVVKFRKDKWKMPWLHSFVEGGFSSPAAVEFEVIGIPRPILVDPEGKIVAMEMELRGPNLDKTLARFLGDVQ